MCAEVTFKGPAPIPEFQKACMNLKSLVFLVPNPLVRGLALVNDSALFDFIHGIMKFGKRLGAQSVPARARGTERCIF